MDLLYNRIILYKRIKEQFVHWFYLYLQEGYTFEVFNKIYFRIALKAVEIGRFSR